MEKSIEKCSVYHYSSFFICKLSRLFNYFLKSLVTRTIIYSHKIHDLLYVRKSADSYNNSALIIYLFNDCSGPDLQNPLEKNPLLMYNNIHRLQSVQIIHSNIFYITLYYYVTYLYFFFLHRFTR